jgi:cytoskeletal protein CcmA (bactofilin family)
MDMLGKKDEKLGDGRDEISAFLGKGTEFDGKLTFEGTVQIDGKFSGEVSTQGTLVVGESAKVEAEINAKSIIISGEVKGNLTATNKVEIHSPGKLIGNVKTQVLVMDEGVIFDGNCQMASRAAEEARAPFMGSSFLEEKNYIEEEPEPPESLKLK